MERKYMMYEGEDVNTIDLLYEASTTEANGVKIIVPVQYGDSYKFQKKISAQLAYFENVYFDCANIENTFTIHRADDFQISDINDDQYVHICLDNVYYPIDWDKLGMQRINLPFGLRFSLVDGLFPTPNRESLRYTQEAISIIRDKIKSVADYFMNKYNESIVETDNIKNIFNFYSSNKRMLNFNGTIYDIADLLKLSSIKIESPILKGVSKIDLKRLTSHREYIFKEYETKYILQGVRMSEVKYRYSSYEDLSTLDSNKTYIFNERIGSNKKAYIKTKISQYDRFSFIKKVKKFSLFPLIKSDQGYNNYYTILGLHSIPRKDWREIITEFQFIINSIVNTFTDFDKIIVPKSWLDARKTKITKSKSIGQKSKVEGNFTCKEAVNLERYVQDKQCKFVPASYSIADITKYKGLTIYTNHDNSHKLDCLYTIGSFIGIKLLTFSDRELKRLEDLDSHNFITVEKFMEGKNKPFKRLVTANLINELIYDYRSAFERIERIKKVSTEFGNNLQQLAEYKNKYLGRNNVSSEVLEIMLSIAKEHNLFDTSIYDVYLKCKAILIKYTFINPVCNKINNWDNPTDPMIDVLSDLFKYYKLKVNLDRYSFKLNENLLLEEQLSEETIEELTLIN